MVVDRPRLCRASSVDANVEDLPTYISRSRKPSFPALMLLSQELCYPSLFSSSMPPPESGAPLIRGRWLCGFQSTCHATCKAGASVTGHGRAAAWSISCFFLGCFRKKLRARATRNKENNISGLKRRNVSLNLPLCQASPTTSVFCFDCLDRLLHFVM